MRKNTLDHAINSWETVYAEKPLQTTDGVFNTGDVLVYISSQSYDIWKPLFKQHKFLLPNGKEIIIYGEKEIAMRMSSFKRLEMDHLHIMCTLLKPVE